jgi:hypothetical protein
MPKVYEAIRDELIARQVEPKQAKTRAAAAYVSKGKNKGARSVRAKTLATHRSGPKPQEY